METLEFHVTQMDVFFATIFFGILVVPLNNLHPSETVIVQSSIISPRGNSYSIIFPYLFLVTLIFMSTK